MTTKKVMVSGCFDLLHSGHIKFFKTASEYGNLYVFIGKDQNILDLKGKAPYYSEKERLYLVNSIKYVFSAKIASGNGMLDFIEDMKNLKPDIFIVNQDGDTAEKKNLCNKLNVKYIVLDRKPEEGLIKRSSTKIKEETAIPYRICLAGGWLDQPWVSSIHNGSVIVAQIIPSYDFNLRSGMATSSRNTAFQLWSKAPSGDPIRNARLLFGAENPPGSKYISGSQDQIGILLPGINKLYYKGEFWPESIVSCIDKETCDWLSSVIKLIPLKPRPEKYNPLIEKNLKSNLVMKLAESAELCFESIIKKDIKGLGNSLTNTFRAWKEILPNTIPNNVMVEMEKKYINKYYGATTSGSGGGYAIVVSDIPVTGAIDIKIKI
ncbi:MAG: adenylyltransferase/cytidyltransferase family protein [Prolixibacteraceae bacterium]